MPWTISQFSSLFLLYWIIFCFLFFITPYKWSQTTFRFCFEAVKFFYSEKVFYEKSIIKKYDSKLSMRCWNKLTNNQNILRWNSWTLVFYAKFEISNIERFEFQFSNLNLERPVRMMDKNWPRNAARHLRRTEATVESTQYVIIVKEIKIL